MSNIVAIVGRPNVGKSTLFNRMVGQRQAITDNISGVTRDRQYGTGFWNGKTFSIIDTGGFVEHSDDIFEAAIREQVDIAIEEATVIIFMTDVMTGITDLDAEIANKLRKSNKKVILTVNKVDNPERQLAANEFWGLGFESTHFLSSISGSGTGEVLDEVAENLSAEEDAPLDIPKIAVIGRPNVGKSSFINALMGEPRHIVTEIAGTTRDSIHTRYNKFGKDFLIIDTAGMRKKRMVEENLEFYSVIRTVKAIEDSDVCMLMLDATTGLESQDLSILQLALRRSKGIVIVVNKWDLIEKETNTARDFEQVIRQKMAPFTDVPILFISVYDKQRIYKAIEIALQVAENRARKIPTSQLNDLIEAAINKQPHPSFRGHLIKIKYGTQLPVPFPAFAMFCNYPEEVKTNYRNFLENQIREAFQFTGSPIRIYFRQK
ncbi:MAG: ribosome biogenesis GTPase Der [Saprospiraceae bacterium]|nr:ribosome biogenesis GTPase Der [Saprospiraceae bacterium]MBP8085948.1 ribosome biogenesis GTPase Der [Saprospiraceae bacterium]